MNMKKVCFTGHRTVDNFEFRKPELEVLLHGLINFGYTYFITGGAIGWDTLCAETILDLQKEYPQIELEIAIPFPGYSENFSKEEKKQVDYTIKNCTRIKTVSKKYSTNVYMLRNDYMVQKADMVIAYWSGKHRSGTAQTIRMAQAKGIPVSNLF